MKISQQVKKEKSKLKTQGRKFAGLRFIEGYEVEVFTSPSQIKIVLENLDRQDETAFSVFTNPNDEIVIRQDKKLPHFYLI